MKQFFKKLLLFFVFILPIFLALTPKAFAATPDFQHTIAASYVVEKDKSAFVTYNIKTTNNLNNNYLTTFTLALPFEPLELSTESSQTPVKVKSLKKLSDVNLYELKIDFTNPIFGKDKAFDWSFSFSLKDLLIEHGMQSAIFLPTFATDTSISSYNINLTIPKVFGEIKNIYGNAGLTDTGKNYQVNFIAVRNQTSNVIVLIGPDQQYDFTITSNENLENKVILPFVNSYQEVLYNEFPSKEFSLDQTKTSNEVIIKKDEKISGIITTKYGKDSDDINGKIYSTDLDFLKNRFKKVTLDNLTIKQKAEKIYIESLLTFNVEKYAITTNLESKITEDKKNLNIEELNLIYKYLLGQAGIQTRGVYGYVFPIQPFERDTYFVEQHIWTEFWDGNEWISVDPAWYISSQGTKYFDNNEFHHIKFGNYFDISEIKSFINSKRFITINPLKTKSEITKTGELEIKSEKTVYLNKELHLSIKNNFNYPILINKISSIYPEKDIQILNSQIITPTLLFPGDTLDLAINFDYKFIFLNKNINFDLKIDYFDGENKDLSISQQINPIIQSNISNYISYLIIGIFILVAGISLIGLSLYKIKKPKL